MNLQCPKCGESRKEMIRSYTFGPIGWSVWALRCRSCGHSAEMDMRKKLCEWIPDWVNREDACAGCEYNGPHAVAMALIEFPLSFPYREGYCGLHGGLCMFKSKWFKEACRRRRDADPQPGDQYVHLGVNV